jgi:hypothetical protein
MAGGTIDTGNLTIGAAKIYFNATVGHPDCLATQAFRTTANSLGNIVSADITPENTYVEHFTSNQGKRVRDKEVVTQSAINVSFTFDEMNMANLRRFFFGTTNASYVFPLQSNIAEGSAQIVVQTQIGKDMIYQIPKCNLRPAGGLTLNPESWHEAPMQLSILEYLDGDYTNVNGTTAASVNASWLAFEFGRIDTRNLA